MNPPRVLIVDDEAPARARLRELLDDIRAEIPHVIAGEAANAIEALDFLNRGDVDLVLADIHMPGMSGIELARHAQSLSAPPAIVFITAHDEHAVAAFEVNAVDYLLKPVRASRLALALGKAALGPRASAGTLGKLDPNPRQFLSVAERGRVTLVPVASILFLKADLKYVTARTREREFLIEESLTHLEQEYHALFARVHRNCLVAKAAIRGVERLADDNGEARWGVILEGLAEPTPVSRRQWAQIKAMVRR